MSDITEIIVGAEETLCLACDKYLATVMRFRQSFRAQKYAGAGHTGIFIHSTGKRKLILDKYFVVSLLNCHDRLFP